MAREAELQRQYEQESQAAHAALLRRQQEQATARLQPAKWGTKLARQQEIERIKQEIEARKKKS